MRERRTRQVQERQYWLSDQVMAIEVEENLDFESPTSWAVQLPGRTAA
jgi:hypothetical protein